MATAEPDDIHQYRVYVANLRPGVSKNDAGSCLDIIVQADIPEVAFCNVRAMCSFW